MKKEILALCFPLMFALMGCSHIGIVAFDKSADTVTVQGGKWASMDDYQAAADNYCGRHASVQNMGMTTVGTYTSSQATAYGSRYTASASGTSTTVGIKRYQYTFKCGE